MIKQIFRKQLRLIDSVRIESPCDVPLSEMSGDETVRFCGSCKKNVYNISSMSEKEAETFLRKNRGQRLCLSIYQRPDNTIMFESCPKGLRKIRQRILKSVVSVLFILGLTYLAQKVQAQGLIGAPVDPRYGGSGEVGGLADYGYDTARDIGSIVTMLSIPITTVFGFSYIRFTKKLARLWYRRGATRRIAAKLVRKSMLQSILLVILIPILIHFFGAFLINSILAH